MANYLVTGGAGFIGSSLWKRLERNFAQAFCPKSLSSIVQALVQKGEFVRVLDNCSTGSLSNLENVISQIEYIQGDIRDLSLVHKAVEGIHYVIHEAVLSSVAQSVDDPLTTKEVNVTGTLNILAAARDATTKRVVFASSASVYGNSPDLPKKEDTPTHPASPYAASKLIAEQYCRLFYELYNLETVILRYFNVFGPRQSCNSHYAPVIPVFINSLLEGKSPPILGDGEQSRDFVFVEDVVNANILACHEESAGGEVFNIAYGKRISINSSVKKIRDLIGSNVESVHKQERGCDVRHSYVDISKAQVILGYKPMVDLDSGLGITIEWFKTRAVSLLSYSS